MTCTNSAQSVRTETLSQLLKRHGTIGGKVHAGILHPSHQVGVVSDEDTSGGSQWTAGREEAIDKVRKHKARTPGAESYILDEKEVERTFWLSRPDGWVMKRKMKMTILLEFVGIPRNYGLLREVREKQVQSLRCSIT
jgi:hypothetical protein